MEVEAEALVARLKAGVSLDAAALVVSVNEMSAALGQLVPTATLTSVEVLALLTAVRWLVGAEQGAHLATTLLSSVLKRTYAPTKRLLTKWMHESPHRSGDDPVAAAVDGSDAESVERAVAVCNGLHTALRTTNVRTQSTALFSLMWKGAMLHANFLVVAAARTTEPAQSVQGCLGAFVDALLESAAQPGGSVQLAEYHFSVLKSFAAKVASTALRCVWSAPRVATLAHLLVTYAVHAPTRAAAIILVDAMAVDPARGQPVAVTTFCALALAIAPPLLGGGNASAKPVDGEAETRLVLGARVLLAICRGSERAAAAAPLPPQQKQREALGHARVELAERLVGGAARCHAVLLGVADLAAHNAPPAWCETAAALDACAACVARAAAAAPTPDAPAVAAFGRLLAFVIATIAEDGHASGASAELVRRLWLALLREAPPSLRAAAIDGVLRLIAACVSADDAVDFGDGSFGGTGFVGGAARHIRFRAVAALATALEHWFRCSRRTSCGGGGRGRVMREGGGGEEAMPALIGRVLVMAPRVMDAAARSSCNGSGSCGTSAVAAMIALVTSLHPQPLTSEARCARGALAPRAPNPPLSERNVFDAATAAALRSHRALQGSAGAGAGDALETRAMIEMAQRALEAKGAMSEAALVAAIYTVALLRHELNSAAELAELVAAVARCVQRSARGGAALQVAAFDLFAMLRDVTITPAEHVGTIYAHFAAIFAKALRQKESSARSGAHRCAWVRWPLALDALRALAEYGATATQWDGLRVVVETLDVPQRSAVRRALVGGESAHSASEAEDAAQLLNESAILATWDGLDCVFPPAAKRARGAANGAANGGAAEVGRGGDSCTALVLALRRACDDVQRAAVVLGSSGVGVAEESKLRAALVRIAAASRPFAF